MHKLNIMNFKIIVIIYFMFDVPIIPNKTFINKVILIFFYFAGLPGESGQRGN